MRDEHFNSVVYQCVSDHYFTVKLLIGSFGLLSIKLDLWELKKATKWLTKQTHATSQELF